MNVVFRKFTPFRRNIRKIRSDSHHQLEGLDFHRGFVLPSFLAFPVIWVLLQDVMFALVYCCPKPLYAMLSAWKVINLGQNLHFTRKRFRLGNCNGFQYTSIFCMSFQHRCALAIIIVSSETRNGMETAIRISVRSCAINSVPGHKYSGQLCRDLVISFRTATLKWFEFETSAKQLDMKPGSNLLGKALSYQCMPKDSNCPHDFPKRNWMQLGEIDSIAKKCFCLRKRESVRLPKLQRAFLSDLNISMIEFRSL